MIDIKTEIRSDSFVICDWLREGGDTVVSLPSDHVLSENIEEHYDLGSAIEYDIYLRRKNG